MRRDGSSERGGTLLLEPFNDADWETPKSIKSRKFLESGGDKNSPKSMRDRLLFWLHDESPLRANHNEAR
jgi:hypothetical protein